MENFFFVLSLIVITAFWLYDAYKVINFYGQVEGAKKWEKRTANLVGIETANIHKSVSKNFIARSFRVIFSPEKFNFFAYFYNGDVKVGVFKFSLYQRHTRHISFFSRKILRSNISTVDVYVNPDYVYEAILIPPSEHKLIGKIVWFGIKTFCLTILMLYLFF